MAGSSQKRDRAMTADNESLAQRIIAKIFAGHFERGMSEVAFRRDERNEIKLGGPEEIDKGAESLLRLRAKLKGGQTGAPARLAVVTATGFAYERPDGVCVVPSHRCVHRTAPQN